MNWTTPVAIALLPFGVFVLTVVSRYIVEITYRASSGWLRELLARDRRSRPSHRERAIEHRQHLL
jgi:hypothetical protein